MLSILFHASTERGCGVRVRVSAAVLAFLTLRGRGSGTGSGFMPSTGVTNVVSTWRKHALMASGLRSCTTENHSPLTSPAQGAAWAGCRQRDGSRLRMYATHTLLEVHGGLGLGSVTEAGYVCMPQTRYIYYTYLGTACQAHVPGARPAAGRLGLDRELLC